MGSSAGPQLFVSKVGVAIGLALLAFGVYATATHVTRGGHAVTLLRALVALPIGVVVIYLSFGLRCSICGAVLKRSALDTSARDAASLAGATASGDGGAAARRFVAARQAAGSTHVGIDYCADGRDLVRVRVSGAPAGGDGAQLLLGEAARPLVDAINAGAPAAD
jgi:hypothetical protein